MEKVVNKRKKGVEKMNRKVIHDNSRAALGLLSENLRTTITTELGKATKDQAQIKTVTESLEKNKFWAAAIAIGAHHNNISDTDEINKLKEIIVLIREAMGRFARQSIAPTDVVFGTSGWRGIIGEDFTVLNVHKVARGIIDMMKSSEFFKTNGYTSFADVQEKGIVVFRDNRYMGEEFMDAVMKELDLEGIKIYDAGECPTGVGSALVTQLGAAGSINITPSHNTMDYAGIKFNPADGGPADTNLTDTIMVEANKYMAADSSFQPAQFGFNAQSVNAAEIYVNYLDEKFKSGEGLFDLAAIRTFLREKKEEVFLVVDNMHGSSRGYIQKILGEELIAELVEEGAIKFVNTNEDYSFHGVKPEPNASNQQAIIDIAKAKVVADSKRRLTLVVALDPDADRIRFGTADSDINMNQFGAIAYGHLRANGIEGAIATTLPSSKFAVAIARKFRQIVHEVLVGFKWFRGLAALVKYEESDGISFRGHTLEKDGIAGFLMALQVMKDQNMDIFRFLKKLQEEYGYYYANQSPRPVTDISISDWTKLRKDVEKDLQTKYNDANEFVIGDVTKKVISTRVDDGIMMVFEDDSWILVRSSGTEPKFRVYYEITSETELSEDQVKATQAQYAEAGLGILNEALAEYGR